MTDTQIQLPVVPRREFLRTFGREYKKRPRHLTMLGPTQRGKSRLCVGLLNAVISPDLRALVLVGKPPGRERTWSDETAKKLRLRIIETWPPGYSFRDRSGNGWMLRPKHGMTDPNADDANLHNQFGKGIHGAYATKPKRKPYGVSGKIITVVDEGHQVQHDLRLKKDCEAPLMRGLPDNAMWTLVQRGRNISYLCYDAPEDVFIFFDPDRSNQQRYAEIGGIDTAEVIEISKSLKVRKVESGGTISQALYIPRSGAMCIVDT